jgi:subtilisin-like proprotein convertase family protein
MYRLTAAVLALLLLAPGCVDDPNVVRDDAAIVDGTPDAVGLIAFLNDGSTTYELLDAELDRRAAANLIDARPFATVDQVDAVKYVGEVTLGRLIEMARAAGYVPEGGDLLGSYDGVAFTVDQAAAALRIVNDESDGVLRGEVGLDSRAIRSILEARPVASMPLLADLYWVGPAGLTHLRDYVDNFLTEPGERADCRFDGDCAADERCEGITDFGGPTPIGKCREVRDYDGYWRGCSDTAPCEDGLFCSGLTWGGGGWCSPDWMQDTFYNETQRYIPADGTTVTTTVDVYGQASVPMDLVVDLDLRHDRPEDLRIVLLDPNGTDAVIWDGPNEGGRDLPTSLIALGNISRDDMVNGRWRLQVTNVGGRGLGNLHSWQLWVSSRYD